MSKRQEQALIGLVLAAVVGALAQAAAKQDAAILGLSALELALFTAAASAWVTRNIS